MESHQDVIVIGGGMAGLLTAYYLQEVGLEVLVLEANTVASGQTGRTTAKITGQHGLKYSQLIHKVGLQKATLYARANEEAIAEYERLIQDRGIDCDFERVPAYLYARKKTQGMGTLWQNQREELLQMAQDLEVLHQEHEAAHQVGIEAYFTEETELPFAVAGAVCFPNQAQFQPLEFVQAIAGQLKILEHTQVLHIKGQRVITEQGEFQADNIVVATHYPMRNVLWRRKRRLFPATDGRTIAIGRQCQTYRTQSGGWRLCGIGAGGRAVFSQWKGIRAVVCTGLYAS